MCTYHLTHMTHLIWLRHSSFLLKLWKTGGEAIFFSHLPRSLSTEQTLLFLDVAKICTWFECLAPFRLGKWCHSYPKMFWNWDRLLAQHSLNQFVNCTLENCDQETNQERTAGSDGSVCSFLLPFLQFFRMFMAFLMGVMEFWLSFGFLKALRHEARTAALTPC